MVQTLADGVPADEAPEDLPQQLRIRRAKYDRLVADKAVYPARVDRTRSLAEVRAAYPDLGADTRTGDVVGVTGRVIFIRNAGKLCFAMLREGGAELQVMLARDSVGAEALAAWKADVDLGDLVFAHGEVVSSRTGELSVSADAWQLTAKALRPLPVAHKSLSDETRVRQRYVDLIVRAQAGDMVRLRAGVTRSLRETLHRLGYLEVETPMLQIVHGGAAARPFHTHLNAFDLDMSLRIATELYLKRCVVGGIERVYEIGKVFRNEGVDSTHSPEFTMLEAYEAYGDYHTMVELARALVVGAARDVGALTPLTADGVAIDLAGPWRSITLHEAVSEAVDEEVTAETDPERLRRHAKRLGVAVRPEWSAGHIAVELFEELVQGSLIQPTIVRDYPAQVAPLARPHRNDERLGEVWDLIVDGVELAHAATELIDPREQRQRLARQSQAAAAGDPEAMRMDEDFLCALEYGMPPTGGIGMGLDRLLMLLTGKGIRETILFPLLKPR
ncbi:MAG: lysine--tRNA ligase [Actinomycetia bacterium]|nr:lysine--tRNA ligase [Actinomycetes bacterium]